MEIVLKFDSFEEMEEYCRKVAMKAAGESIVRGALDKIFDGSLKASEEDTEEKQEGINIEEAVKAAAKEPDALEEAAPFEEPKPDPVDVDEVKRFLSAQIKGNEDNKKILKTLLADFDCSKAPELFAKDNATIAEFYEKAKEVFNA